MDHSALYQQKLTTAAEAVKAVKSGDWVDYGWCTGTPVALDKATTPSPWIRLWLPGRTSCTT